MLDIGDVALALTIAGALFLLRFVLIVRRLGRLSGKGAGTSVRAHARNAHLSGGFGAELEPERRYAMRQFYAGAVFAGAGLAAAAWMLVVNVLGPFVSRAMGN